MDSNVNRITAGDYKNSDIVLKGNNVDIPVLVYKGFLSKKEIFIDKTTVKMIKHSFLSVSEHEIIIEWKDGKLSQAVVDDVVYAAIIAKM